MPLRLRRYVFFSQLAPETTLSRAVEGFQKIRVIAKDTGLTGILVFDGAYFCHYLEGPYPALRSLVARIAMDERHMHMTPLVDDDLPDERLFRGWATAYTTQDVVDELLVFQSLRGQAAIDRLVALLPSLDGCATLLNPAAKTIASSAEETRPSTPKHTECSVADNL